MRKLLFFVVLGSLLAGVTSIWNWIRHREPVPAVLTTGRQKDLPVHVRLTGIHVSPLSAVIGQKFGRDVVYVPVRSMADVKQPQIPVLLLTNDKDFIALSAKEWKGANGEEQGVFDRALMRMVSKEEVVGMREQLGSDRDRETLRKEIPELLPDFVIIKEGAKPSLGGGIFCLVISAGAFGLMGLLGGKTSAPPVVPPAEPPPLPKTG